MRERNMADRLNYERQFAIGARLIAKSRTRDIDRHQSNNSCACQQNQQSEIFFR